MNSLDRFSNLVALQKEKGWQIDIPHAVKVTSEILNIYSPGFYADWANINTNPLARERLGDLSQPSKLPYSFVSKTPTKCWIVFANVIIGKGGQSCPRLACEYFSGEIGVWSLFYLLRQTEYQLFQSEIACMTRLIGKPYMLQLRDYIYVRSVQGLLYGGIIAEYCPHGDLNSLLMRTKKDFSSLAPDLIDAVKIMHNEGIIHRDLKLDNIFLDTFGRIKIGDFGFSCFAETCQLQLGSPTYAAFELFDDSNQKSVTSKIDVWSLGVTLHGLFHRRFPEYAYLCKDGWLKGEKFQEVKEAFAKTITNFGESPIGQFFKQFFVLDPNLRPSIFQIKPISAFVERIPPNLLSLTSIEEDQLKTVFQQACKVHAYSKPLMVYDLRIETKKARTANRTVLNNEDIRCYYYSYARILLIFKNVLMDYEDRTNVLSYDLLTERIEWIPNPEEFRKTKQSH